MVILPVLEAPVVFSATEIFTVPLPVPLLPEVIVAQSRLSDAVQAQLLAEAVTVTLAEADDEVNDWLFGEMVKEHAAD